MSSDETLAVSPALARPNPGGRVGGESPASSETVWATLGEGRLRPLLAAAVPLLNLCVRIKNSAAHPDIEGMRLGVLREIDRFERHITPLGLAPRAIRASKYALSATIDDLVLSTPWGCRSIWTTRSMVGTLFSETWGGDRFFDLVAQLKKDPGVNVDLLELLYYCLSLGFEGKCRVAVRGASEHTLLREDLYRLIRAARGEFERDISPHWRGVVADQPSLGRILPAWVVAVSAAVLLMLLYAALSLSLNRQSDAVFEALARLPPSGVVSLARVVAPPPAPVIVIQSERLRKFLEPEIREGLVTVKEDAQTITVLIRGAGMFDSGRETLQTQFEPLLKRIGQALNDQPGAVVITGYTDNAPIRTLAFPSNWHLSVARAQTVARIVKGEMADSARVTEDGKGAVEPIATNDTADGRQQNRRTEIIISKISQVAQ